MSMTITMIMNLYIDSLKSKIDNNDNESNYDNKNNNDNDNDNTNSLDDNNS